MRVFGVLLMALMASYSISSVATASESVGHDHGSHTLTGSAHNISTYSRINTTVSLSRTSTVADIPDCSLPGVECRNFIGDTVDATLRCTGATLGGNLLNGGWASDSVVGQCFQQVDFCYGVGTPAEVCTTVTGSPATDANVEYGQHSACTPDPVKGHCVIDYDGSAGITGATNDDMFAIENPAGAFFEYTLVGGLNDPDRLKWMSRNGGGARGLMMPSGPSATFDDYRNFLVNAPSFVTIEPACYPVNLNLCSTNGTITAPPADGVCGLAGSQATGKYASLSEIPAADFCYIGDASSKSENATQITWSCSGLNGGAVSSCTAPKSLDGMCGTAHTEQFDTLADLSSANLCAAGSASAISGTGPWQWDCSATAAGGSPASCIALETGKECEKFFVNDNMVFVQDVSGSFGDDIDNIANALTVLFNDPVFDSWNVGITRFSNNLPAHYVKANDFLQVREYDDATKALVTDNSGTLVANTMAHKSVIGGSENAFHGIVTAIDDFKGQTPEGETMTVVLVTDEGPGGYHGKAFNNAAAATQAIVDNNVRFVALTTGGGVGSYFKTFANNVKGEQVTITADSSNFYQALLRGLVEVNCE